MKTFSVYARGLALAGILVAIAGCQTVPQTPAPPVLGEAFTPIDPAAQVAEMKRGVNVLAGDPGWTDPAKARFTPKYFKIIHDAGFSTVRVVMNPFASMDDAGHINPVWLHHLDLMAKTALAQGLQVILDEHDYETCGKDAATCRTKLLAFWSQIAPRYKNASNRLMFEMLNEPHGVLTPEAWNALLKETLAVIRSSNPTRNVVIGPSNWNGLEDLPQLQLPADDHHIIVTFHYYHPMEFTHQGAPWVPQYKKLGVTWGTAADYALLNKEFDTVKAWSVAHNRPIFLGEFGAYETGAMADRLRWTNAVARAAEKRGFAWAYWQFDHDFIVYNIDEGHWTPILSALIPTDASSPP